MLDFITISRCRYCTVYLKSADFQEKTQRVYRFFARQCRSFYFKKHRHVLIAVEKEIFWHLASRAVLLQYGDLLFEVR